MKDLLKQIRNEWRANLWLGVELLVVFCLLWYLLDWGYVTLRTWLQPMGFDTEHCYNLTFNRLTPQADGYRADDDADTDMKNLLEIVERLRHRPGVEYVAVSQNSIPYGNGANGFTLGIDSTTVTAKMRLAQTDFLPLFRVQGVAIEAADGRTVATTRPEDLADAVHRSGSNILLSDNFVSPVVTPGLGYDDATALLGNDYPYGSTDSGELVHVAGICKPMRASHFRTADQWEGPLAFVEMSDATVLQMGNPLYVQVSLRLAPEADTGQAFMDALLDDADRLYTLGNVFLLDVQPFSALQETLEMDDVNEARTQLCIMGFLLLNIFLGVIGTFWFRTQHRRSEIALRMSFGCTRRGVFARLIAEGLLLLTVAAVPAVLIAFNVGWAELVDVERISFSGGRFVVAVVGSWVLMALMIVVGIWYPARRAMQIQPAAALHDE